MSWKRTALLIAAVLGAFCVFSVLWQRRKVNEAIGFQFVCMTNIPGIGPQALFKITNLTPDLIICQNYGYLDSGESGTVPCHIPAGTGPWRASVLWQRRDLTRLEELLNLGRYYLVEFLGLRRNPDPWIPLKHVSYSPEFHR